MRVAHINCLLSKNGRLGVEKKLAARAKAISLLGLNMDIFYFNFGRQVQDKRVRFFERREGSLNRLFTLFRRYDCVAGHLDTDQYDLIILRYTGGDFSAFSKFFRDNGHKIITEHQAMEFPEARTYQTTLPQKLTTLFMERFLGPRMIRRCAGLIGNCDEVRAYEIERIGVSIPSCTITDGVSVDDTPFSRTPPYTGRVLNLLCLATSFHPWQGLDRVLAGLKTYSRQEPVLSLKIVGEAAPEHLASAGHLKHNPCVTVDFLGRLFGPRLEEIFEKTHIAFSPLTMFRKRLKGGSALKTREYVARGLPFVIGHCDPDLEGVGDFFLSVPPDDSPVNMSDVVRFAERILNRPSVSESMRQFATAHLDWKIKMSKMWEFCDQVRRMGRVVPPANLQR
ncbi:MAG: glycosyltransferase [Deltaproteobacteria bacterium]|nr:glycosyltransferase [Deltaproteobacteria bacterium]